jgi:serine/threonine protein kinase
MELMRGGQLTQMIEDRKKKQLKFSDEEASNIIRQVLTAVDYLHKNEIVHRDLKPGKH